MASPAPPAGDDAGRVGIATLGDVISLGAPLPFQLFDAQGRLLLNLGQTISGEPQWRMLVERGAWADAAEVAAARARLVAQGAEAGGGPGSSTGDAAGSTADPNAPSAAPAARRLSLFDGWERRVWQLDELLRQVLRGAPVAAALSEFADEHAAWINHDPDVALFLAMRRDDDRRFALYALTHGQYTATVSVLTARQLGWDTARQRTLVRAALCMNVAILELQATLAEQSTPPTQRQRALIEAHPLRSRELLEACGVDDPAWLGTVAEHHEQDGGKGYPRGLGSVAPEPMLLHAADVFLAKISPRAQRPALSPQVAARQLFQQAGGGPLASALIQAIGLYPPGDLVKLHSGEVAVITRRGPTPTTPLAATLSDPRGRPQPHTTPRNTADPAFAITGALADRSAYPRVLPERVYGLIDSPLPPSGLRGQVSTPARPDPQQSTGSGLYTGKT